MVIPLRRSLNGIRKKIHNKPDKTVHTTDELRRQALSELKQGSQISHIILVLFLF